eukprot:TRINITY_DN1270_c3_g4_i1.p1 TRINITY_DN1270_c3_g4~~TRINITY_DN1270_c3_g4_i1.p1  ORF type:complete len:418 (-),score=3.26 TRINITY_DN1270_c3_g4_i1:105-1250(-)
MGQILRFNKQYIIYGQIQWSNNKSSFDDSACSHSVQLLLPGGNKQERCLVSNKMVQNTFSFVLDKKEENERLMLLEVIEIHRDKIYTHNYKLTSFQQDFAVKLNLSTKEIEKNKASREIQMMKCWVDAFTWCKWDTECTIIQQLECDPCFKNFFPSFILQENIIYVNKQRAQQQQYKQQQQEQFEIVDTTYQCINLEQYLFENKQYLYINPNNNNVNQNYQRHSSNNNQELEHKKLNASILIVGSIFICLVVLLFVILKIIKKLTLRLISVDEIIEIKEENEVSQSVNIASDSQTEFQYENVKSESGSNYQNITHIDITTNNNNNGNDFQGGLKRRDTGINYHVSSSSRFRWQRIHGRLERSVRMSVFSTIKSEHEFEGEL